MVERKTSLIDISCAPRTPLKHRLSDTPCARYSSGKSWTRCCIAPEALPAFRTSLHELPMQGQSVFRNGCSIIVITYIGVVVHITLLRRLQRFQVIDSTIQLDVTTADGFFRQYTTLCDGSLGRESITRNMGSATVPVSKDVASQTLRLARGHAHGDSAWLTLQNFRRHGTMDRPLGRK